MTTSPMKNDDGKPRYDLLPPKALGLLVDCLTYGAKKYDDYNWRKDGGIDPNRLFAATQRHLWAWKEGEVLDKESGLPHLAHAATNLLMMLDLACRPPVKIPNFMPPKPVQDLTPSEIEAGLERAGWPKEPEPSSEEKLWATPAQPLDVTNALMELRTKYLGVVYDIVSEWENVRYFDAGCSTALTLAHLGLFGYARSFTTMQGKERDEYNRTPLGYAVREVIHAKS